MTKLTTLTDAIARYVKDGDTVYAAGFTHLIPFAAGHEIIRQGRKNLVLARATPDLIYEMMVAAGCAKKVIFSYIGNPGVGSLRIVRHRTGSRAAGMGGVFAFLHDLPSAGRSQRAAFYAHEPDRSHRPRTCQSAVPAGERSLHRAGCDRGAAAHSRM